MLETLIAFTVLANAVRTAPVAPNLALSEVAQHRAEELCKTGQWSHDGWLKSFQGMSYTYAGENLARGFETPQETQSAWMASADHRSNVIKPQYTEIGIGQACGITVELFRG